MEDPNLIPIGELWTVATLAKYLCESVNGMHFITDDGKREEWEDIARDVMARCPGAFPV